MIKYLEQTAWLLNPAPDGRKNGRWKKQSFVEGTRWEYDEKRGRVYGDGMKLDGEHAAKIVANCKEVEPGFAVIVDQFNYQQVIGELIDQGKITVSDIQTILRIDEQQDDLQEDDENEDALKSSELLWRQEQEEYRYRHWLSLDPPSEEMIRNVAEQGRRNAILDEYVQRNQQENPAPE